jgi:hypothetical protein
VNHLLGNDSESTSADPSASPSDQPIIDTGIPSSSPSDSPSNAPSQDVSADQSGTPFGSPSYAPTEEISVGPSSSPSFSPTNAPSEDVIVTNQPSLPDPSNYSSLLPSVSPTVSPSNAPSGEGDGSPLVPTECPPTLPVAQACIDFIQNNCFFVDGVFDGNELQTGNCTFTTNPLELRADDDDANTAQGEDGGSRRRLAEIDYHYRRIQHLSSILEELKQQQEDEE